MRTNRVEWELSIVASNDYQMGVVIDYLGEGEEMGKICKENEGKF